MLCCPACAQLIALQKKLGKFSEAMMTLQQQIEDEDSSASSVQQIEWKCQIVELLHESGETQRAKSASVEIAESLHEKLNDDRWLDSHGLFGPFKYDARHWNDENDERWLSMGNFGGVGVPFIKRWGLLEPLLAAQRQTVGTLGAQVHPARTQPFMTRGLCRCSHDVRSPDSE